MNDEIELKLALSHDDQKRLRRHPLVRSLARGRGRSRTLVSTYFDTPDRRLRDLGMALRVRAVGARRVQTLKAVVSEGEGAAKHYREFEADLPGDLPDLTQIDDEMVRATLTAEDIPARLAPAFATRFKRYAIPMRFADSEVEMALDEGEIVATGTEGVELREPISEVEFELLSGRPTRLYELALALGERIPFRPERRTKAARGYALTEPVDPRAVKASDVALNPSMSTRQALEAAVRSCLAQISANEAVVFAGSDLEGVHQMRVGVRRLRALIAAFRPVMLPDAMEYLREELGWLQQGLGGAREWDVFIDETLAPLVRRLTGTPGLDALQAASREQRQQAYAEAGATLLDPRYTRLLLRLDLWLADGGWLMEAPPGDTAPCEFPISQTAAAILDKRDRRLRKLSRRHKALSEEEMHDIRLLAKKKRYCVEALASLYPAKVVKNELASLKAIQNSLGTYNDAVVGRSLLDSLEATMKPEGFAPMARAVAAVRGWQAATMERDIRAFRRLWKVQEAGKRFWR